MKKHLKSNNKNKKNITIVTAALLVVVLVVAVGIFSATTSIIIQSAQAYIDPVHNLERPKAPAVITGENIYIV